MHKKTQVDESPVRVFKGRGAANAPSSRFAQTHYAPFDDGWERDEADAPPPKTEIKPDTAKSILSENDSPDIPHQLSANPYRGCEHGCVYCFARPSHAFLGLSAGLDFETKIYAKYDAPELLRRELQHPRYTPRPLSLGINTDAYQPIERQLNITRQMLEILHACAHPVSLITKSALIERDIDLLARMAQHNLVQVAISMTSLNSTITRKLEPRAASPARRLKIIANLSQANIPTSVLMAPIIPSITDGEIESLLAAAAAAGAESAGYVVLRLPHELKIVFRQWLESHMPQRAQKVMSQVQSLHGGHDYRSEFFVRHRGCGVLAELIARRFANARRRYGLDNPRQRPLSCDLFRPPATPQGNLFS